MKSVKIYSADGMVYGKCWGGGFGGYPAERLDGYDSQEALIKEATEMLDDGSLDSGMGFEYLKGALLSIKETEEIIIKGKLFTSEEYEMVYIGDLTEEEEIQLEEWTYNY